MLSPPPPAEQPVSASDPATAATQFATARTGATSLRGRRRASRLASVVQPRTRPFLLCPQSVRVWGPEPDRCTDRELQSDRPSHRRLPGRPRSTSGGSQDTSTEHGPTPGTDTVRISCSSTRSTALSRSGSSISGGGTSPPNTNIGRLDTPISAKRSLSRACLDAHSAAVEEILEARGGRGELASRAEFDADEDAVPAIVFDVVVDGCLEVVD
jgi:hypothetical protein